MSEKIVIRRIENSDAEEWVKLKDMVWRSSYSEVFPEEVFRDQESRLEERIETFKNRNLNKNGHIGFVATINKKIIAFADGTTLSWYDHYRQLGYADLGGIYINPDYQHLGLGRRLFDKVVKEFKKLGCDKLVIGVLKANAQARNAYKKWGAKMDDKYEKPFVKLGVEYPEVFYLYQIKK